MNYKFLDALEVSPVIAAVKDDEAALKAIAEEVRAFTADFPLPQF